MSRALSTRIVIALTIVFSGTIPLEAEAGPPRTRKGSGKPGASSQHRTAAAAPTDAALLSCLLGKVSDTGSAAAMDLRTSNEWDAFRAAIASDPARSSKPDQLDGLTAQSFMSELLATEYFYRKVREELDFRNQNALGPFQTVDVSGYGNLHPDMQVPIADAIARRVVFDLPYLRDVDDLPARAAEAEKLGIPVTEYVTILHKLHWMMKNGHGPDVIEGIRFKLSVDGTALAPKVALVKPRGAPPKAAPEGPREMVVRPLVAADSPRTSLATKGASRSGPPLAEMLASRDPPSVQDLEAWTAGTFPQVETLFKSPYFTKTYFRIARELVEGDAGDLGNLWTAFQLPEKRASFFAKLEDEFLTNMSRSQFGLDPKRYRALLAELDDLQRADPDALTKIMAWQLLHPGSITATNVGRELRWWKLDPRSKGASIVDQPPLPPSLKAFRDFDGMWGKIRNWEAGRHKDPYFKALDKMIDRQAPELNSRQLIRAMTLLVESSNIRRNKYGSGQAKDYWRNALSQFTHHYRNRHFTQADAHSFFSRLIEIAVKRRSQGRYGDFTDVDEVLNELTFPFSPKKQSPPRDE